MSFWNILRRYIIWSWLCDFFFGTRRRDSGCRDSGNHYDDNSSSHRSDGYGTDYGYDTDYGLGSGFGLGSDDYDTCLSSYDNFLGSTSGDDYGLGLGGGFGLGSIFDDDTDW